MKNALIFFFLFLVVTVTLMSCSVIGDIFKAGVWVGVLVVAAVVGLVIFIIAKSAKK